MPTTIEALQHSRKLKSSAALMEYRDLIARNSTPQEADAERLATVLDVLGLSLVDAEHDAEAMEQMAELEAALATPDPEGMNYRETRARLNAYMEETEAMRMQVIHQERELQGRADMSDEVLRLMGVTRTAGATTMPVAEMTVAIQKIRDDFALVLLKRQQETRKLAAENDEAQVRHGQRENARRDIRLLREANSRLFDESWTPAAD